MPTSFVKGDALEEAATRSGPRALAVVADCGGAMDVGVAIAVRKRWPALAEAYRAACATRPLEPGDVFAWRDDDLVIYVMALERGGKAPKVAWLQRALTRLVDRAKSDGVGVVLLPRVTAGKPPMDPVRVKRVLTDAGASTSAELVVFEQLVRGAPRRDR